MDPECGIKKKNYADGYICNVQIILWGERDWQAGDEIEADYSLQAGSPARGAGPIEFVD